MKTFILFCSMVVVFVSTLAFAEGVEPLPPTTDIVITKDMLLDMDDNSRNIIFESLKSKEPPAVADTLKGVVSDETLELISDFDIGTFKGKTMAVADTLVSFCERLGVTVNEFMATGTGTLVIFGIIYKLGVFSSVWGVVKGTLVAVFLGWLILQLNTQKKVVLEEKDHTGKVINTKEILVSKFNAVFTDDKDGAAAYRAIASVICFVVLCLTIVFT